MTSQRPSRGRTALTNPNTGISNGGSDNINGDLIVYAHDQIYDQVANYFEVVGLLGSGAFGQVFEVLLPDENNDISLKFALKISKSRDIYRSQAVAEANILQFIKDNFEGEARNYISIIHSHFSYKNHECIVLDLLGHNLFEVLAARNYIGLPLRLVKQVLKCVLTVVSAASTNGIIHADLKPENICLADNVSMIVKVIDFGSARRVNEIQGFYIESRYYRAPELILHLPYDTKIDTWSAACVGFEMFCGLPLFPGQNEEHMICLMNQLIEPFPEDMVRSSPRRLFFFDEHQRVLELNEMLESHGISSLNFRQYFTFPDYPQTIRNYGRTPSVGSFEFLERENFIDFLQQCLQLDPQQRPTASEALQHPFFSSVSNLPRNQPAH